MKNTTLSIILSIAIVGQMVPAAVFAQSVFDYNYGTTYDYNYGGNTYDYNYNGTTYDYNYGGGTTYDYNYVIPTGTTYDYNYVTPTYVDVGYTNVSYTTPTYTTPAYTPYTPTYTTPTYTTPTYTTPTYLPYTPPVTTTIPVVNTVVCSDGLAPVNGSCTRTTTVPVVNTVVCADGLAPVNGSCNRTTTVPVVNTVVCSDGLAPINGSCVRTNTIPTTTNIVCADGASPVNGSCVRTVVAPTVTYQTCWDGSTIPLYSVCPAQYKTCANGTSIPVNQTCYYAPRPAPAPAPVPAPVIKFNNVITSVTTEITKSSARCNGIGLIAAGAQSTGWFEYGETANLGRETGKANIGSSPTAPFSNVLANLKPSTTYYCRAVMQNQYGTVKGEVVSFKTKATAVSYVKPVTTTKKTTTTTTKTATVAKKSQIICIDGTIVSGGSVTTTNLLNSGQKLVSLQMEKVSGSLSAGGNVNYKLGFKNLSDEALKNVTIKVTVPTEVTFTQASSGTFDPSTRTLTTVVPSLPAGAEGSIGWTGTVGNNVAVGTPVAMTGYAGYTVPGTDAQDEVTAYTTGTIVPPTKGGADAGAKNVVGATSTERGFLPDSLVEWLALIAIIFIIFILGRSVYVSYKEDRGSHH